MRWGAVLCCLLPAACGRSAEPQVAEQPTVEVPAASDEKPADDASDADELLVSHRDRARPSSGDEEAAEVELEPDRPSSPYPWPHAAGPTGGPDCEALADCCVKLMAVMGNASSDPRVCDQLRIAPASVCAQGLSQVARIATQHGVRCQP